jgi:hypothetical protein
MWVYVADSSQFLTPGASHPVSSLTRVCVVYMLVCTSTCMGSEEGRKIRGGGEGWNAQVCVPFEKVCLLVRWYVCVRCMSWVETNAAARSSSLPAAPLYSYPSMRATERVQMYTC